MESQGNAKRKRWDELSKRKCTTDCRWITVPMYIRTNFLTNLWNEKNWITIFIFFFRSNKNPYTWSFVRLPLLIVHRFSSLLHLFPLLLSVYHFILLSLVTDGCALFVTSKIESNNSNSGTTNNQRLLSIWTYNS